MSTETNNSEYFTLEEDSEVEEFVAEDPNYKRKLFWYDLVEKTIRCVSIRELLIQALLSGFGFCLHLKLILYYISTKDYVSLTWTLTLAVLAGIGNAAFFFFHRDPNAENKLLPRRLSSKLLPAVQVLRHIFCLGMMSPIFNLFYYWLDIIKCKKELRQPLVLRTQPQPTKAEMLSVQKSLEGHLERCQFLLIETALKFIPFALVQSFLYVHQEFKLIDLESEDVNVNVNQNPDESHHLYGIRAWTIFWNLLALPLACTIYSNAHFHYTNSLQFQDLRDLGSSMNLSQVSGINSCFSFLNNFFSAGFRLYCIAVLMATVHYWTIAFILGFYLLFHFLVSIMPARSRLRYENPPSGMSTSFTDLVNRWINMFCCHAVKYECFIHFSYVFTIVYLVPRMVWISTEWSNIAASNGTDNATGNWTWNDSFDACLELEDRRHVLLQVPVLTTVVEFSFKLIMLISRSCSPYLGLIQNDYGTFILFGIQYSLSLFYMVKAKSRIGFETEFPVQIAHRFWARWLSREWEFNDIFEMKKLILCIVLSDSDVDVLAKNQRNWSAWFCPKIRKPVNSTEMEITSLWKLYEKKANGVIFLPTLERVEQILERRKALRNSTECDLKLNLFLEFLTEHYVLEEDTLRILLYALENFDDIVSRSNSLRLSQLDLILK